MAIFDLVVKIALLVLSGSAFLDDRYAEASTFLLMLIVYVLLDIVDELKAMNRGKCTKCAKPRRVE